MTSGIRFELKSVTPELAKKLLDTNTHNRHALRAAVTRLANCMRDGLWRPAMNDLIAFNSKGQLINGQHRLLAVIESGCTVDMYFMYNVPSENQRVMDTNRYRSLGQVLALDGYSDSSARSAAYRLFTRLAGGPASQVGYEAVERFSFLEKSLDKVLKIEQDEKTFRKAGLPGTVAVLEYFKAGTSQSLPFYITIIEGQNLKKNSPELKFRDWFLRTTRKNVETVFQRFALAFQESLRNEKNGMFKPAKAMRLWESYREQLQREVIANTVVR